MISKNRTTPPAVPPRSPSATPAETTNEVREVPEAPEVPEADIERISRDERHLATYPIALLSYQSKVGATISQTRERRHPVTKKTIKATWDVLGSEKYGLPTASDDAVVMVLLELSREQRFPRQVTFSRHDLIRRLGWPYNSASYDKIKLAFVRLNALTIQSENVFWNERAGSFIASGFHLIEEFELIIKPGRRKAGDDESLSWFRWGEPLWFSFRDGNLKPVSLDVYFSLSLPIARRLYRFLDLVRYDGKPRYRIGLRKLCEEYLALSPQRYLSKYKDILSASHDELVTAGYLRRVSYEEAKDGGENVLYDFVPLRSSGGGLGNGLGSPSDESPTPSSLAGQAVGHAPRSRAHGQGELPFDAPFDVPASEAPLSFAVALSLAQTEPEAWDAAADAVAERLGPEERERARESVVAALPPFLRAEMSSPVTQRLIENGLRARVREAHESDVARELERQVLAQVEARVEAELPLVEVSDDAQA